MVIIGYNLIITNCAQRELPDIVFVDIDTELYKANEKEEVFGSIEAVLYCLRFVHAIYWRSY